MPTAPQVLWSLLPYAVSPHTQGKTGSTVPARRLPSLWLGIVMGAFLTPVPDQHVTEKGSRVYFYLATCATADGLSPCEAQVTPGLVRKLV